MRKKCRLFSIIFACAFSLWLMPVSQVFAGEEHPRGEDFGPAAPGTQDDSTGAGPPDQSDTSTHPEVLVDPTEDIDDLLKPPTGIYTTTTETDDDPTKLLDGDTTTTTDDDGKKLMDYMDEVEFSEWYRRWVEGDKRNYGEEYLEEKDLEKSDFSEAI